MKRSKARFAGAMKRDAPNYMKPVYTSGTWEYLNPMSKGHYLATTSIDDLMNHFLSGRVKRTEFLLHLFRRRCLFRGSLSPALSQSANDSSKDSVSQSVSHLNSFSKIKALGFFGEHLFTTEFEAAFEAARQQDSDQQQKLGDSWKRPLSGTVFDVKAVQKQNSTFMSMEGRLTDRGAIQWGNTESAATLTLPETDLLHPYHSYMQVGGSSSAALSVACGLSQFSIGSNGGGSNRIPAGMLGLCGLVFGHRHLKQSLPGFIGPIARTPHDMALICASLNDPNLEALNVTRNALRTPYPMNGEPEIGYFTEMKKDDFNACVEIIFFHSCCRLMNSIQQWGRRSTVLWASSNHISLL